jgi:hypothetical protein
MQAITAIGLDIAKSVFQVHGIDAQGKVMVLITPSPLPPRASMAGAFGLLLLSQSRERPSCVFATRSRKHESAPSRCAQSQTL